MSPAFLEAFYEGGQIHVRDLDHLIAYIHGISSCGLFAGVALGKCLDYVNFYTRPFLSRTYPVKGVGKGVFAEVAQNLGLNLELGEFGWNTVSRANSNQTCLRLTRV